MHVLLQCLCSAGIPAFFFYPHPVDCHDIIGLDTEVLRLGLQDERLILEFNCLLLEEADTLEIPGRNHIVYAVLRGHAVTSDAEEEERAGAVPTISLMIDTFAYFLSPVMALFTWARGEMYFMPLMVYMTALPERVIHAFPTGKGLPAVFITSEMSNTSTGQRSRSRATSDRAMTACMVLISMRREPSYWRAAPMCSKVVSCSMVVLTNT